MGGLKVWRRALLRVFCGGLGSRDCILTIQVQAVLYWAGCSWHVMCVQAELILLRSIEAWTKAEAAAA